MNIKIRNKDVHMLLYFLSQSRIHALCTSHEIYDLSVVNTALQFDDNVKFTIVQPLLFQNHPQGIMKKKNCEVIVQPLSLQSFT